MNKVFKTMLAVGALVSFANAADKISDKEIKEIEALNLFKGAQVTINQGYDSGDMYLLNVTARGRASKIYLTKDKKYLIAGDVINTTTGKPLEVPVDLAPTVGKEAFTFGKGNDEYVLFTDPECPYCKKFESYFSQIEDKVKFKVFFFPLQFHKNAKDLSLYIMSKKSNDEKVKALLSTEPNTPEFINRKIDKKDLEKLNKELASNMEIASKLGISGTPTLYDKSGNKVSWFELLKSYGVDVK